MQTSLGSASLEKKKIVANLFFPGVIDPGTNKYNRIVKTWTCSACPSRKDPIWADLSHGCHNLINHIQSRHGRQWAEKYEEYIKAGSKPFFDKVSDKAKDAYNVIEHIIMTNSSLSLVDNFYFRRFKQEACCRRTLTNYIMRLSNVVCLHIKEEMPTKIGIVLDGWTGQDKVYYVGIFAHYVVDGVFKRPLIAICPPVVETSHSSNSYYLTILSTLRWYGKSVDDIAYIISDNCSTMKSLAGGDFLNKPFIGCASHKLNLAVKRFLGINCKEGSEAWKNRTKNQVNRQMLIKVCHDACVTLRSTLNIAILREEMEEGSFVIPLLDQETRWTSIMDMLTRFVRLYPTMATIKDFHASLPSLVDYHAMKDLAVELSVLKDAMVKLQGNQTNIYHVNFMFKALMRRYPGELNHYLEQDSVFERAIFNILNNTPLSPEELDAAAVFEIADTTPTLIPALGSFDADVEIEINLFKKNKVAKYDLDWINNITPTSCQVERLFSKAGLCQGKLRTRMLSKLFEARMILKENKEYWLNVYYNASYQVRIDQGHQMMQQALDEDEEDISCIDDESDED